MLINIKSKVSYLSNKLRRKFYIKPKKVRSLKKFLKDIFDSDFKDFDLIRKEILLDNKNHIIMQNNFKSKNINYSIPQDSISWHVLVYYLVRKLKPKVLIETGVHHGESTFYLLEALRKNNSGKLYSIDYPAYPEKGGYTSLNPHGEKGKDNLILLPENCEPGWAIPESLKKEWDLTLGKSSDKLVPLLNKLGQIDFFLHDSLHSYENMFFEFQEALKYMKKGGLISADNINWNSSFYDFCNQKELIPFTYLAYTIDPSLAHPFGVVRID